VLLILSCLCGALAYEAVFVLVNFQKGKRKSALFLRLPESLVFGAATGVGILVREKMGNSEHAFLTFILVFIAISSVGQLLLYYIKKNTGTR